MPRATLQPDRQAQQQAAQPVERQHHPGHERLARGRCQCRIVRISRGPPRMTSWCATSPGSRTEWIGTLPPIPAAVAFTVPDDVVDFVSAWSSIEIFRMWERARGLGRGATFARAEGEFGAGRARIRCARASASRSARAGTPGPSSRSRQGHRPRAPSPHCPERLPGAVGIMAASKPAASITFPASTPVTSCPATSGHSSNGAHLALPAEEQDPHAARATASGLIRSTAVRKRFSLGPMPAAESRSGA